MNQLELPVREGNVVARSDREAALGTPERDEPDTARLLEAVGHLSPGQRVVLGELNGTPLTDREIADAAGLILRRTRDHLSALAEAGLVERLERHRWRRV